MRTTYKAIAPAAIVYSYEWQEPINLVEYMDSVNFTRTIVSSIQDTATVALHGPEIAELISPGDWVQIDLYESTDFREGEHYFFGRITDILHNSRNLGQTLGVTTGSVINVESWGQVLSKFMADIRRWVLLKVRDLSDPSEIPDTFFFEDIFGTSQAAGDLPTLASVLRDIGEALGGDARRKAVMPTPLLAIQLYLELYVRFGGALRQEFEMPVSWGDGKAHPLHNFIAKLNTSRVSGGSELVDLQLVSDLQKSLGAKFQNAGWYDTEKDSNVGSAWTKLYDWPSYFAKNAYYPIARTLMSDATSINQVRPTWTGCLDWCDPGFTELFVSLAERVRQPNNRLQNTITTHDGVKFQRNFLPSIVFRPIPHPVYQAANVADVKPLDSLQEGSNVIEADSSGYDATMKFLIDVSALEGFDGRRSMADYRSYWITKPEGILFGEGGLSQHDDAMIAKAANWRIPVLDNHAMNIYGNAPEETYTKYLFGDTGQATPEAFWAVLTKKTYLSYAWTIKGLDHFTGTLSFPLLSHNLPRPGDVGIIVGSPMTDGRKVESETLGSLLGADRGGPDVPANRISGRLSQYAAANNVGEPITISALMEQFDKQGKLAFSVYVESVGVESSADPVNGVSSGSVTIHYSHGQVITLEKQWKDMASRFREPLVRFLKYSEVGIEPKWWLPWYFDIGGLMKEVTDEIDRSLSELDGDDQILRVINRIKRPTKRVAEQERGRVPRSQALPPSLVVKAAKSLVKQFPGIAGAGVAALDLTGEPTRKRRRKKKLPRRLKKALRALDRYIKRKRLKKLRDAKNEAARTFPERLGGDDGG